MLWRKINNSSKGRDKMRRNGAIRLGVGKVFQSHGGNSKAEVLEAGVTRKFWSELLECR